MISSLDTCIEALRFLARSFELEATRLITAELRIHEFLAPVALMPTALRASLEELDNAVNQEAAFGLDAASFWEGVRCRERSNQGRQCTNRHLSSWCVLAISTKPH